MRSKARSILVVSFISGIFASMLLFGCTRQQTSDRPPIHPIRNMYDQPKYKPQEEGKFFADSAAMRTPVAGTVERGYLRNDDIYYKGINSEGRPVKEAPVDVTLQLLNRGHERFDIYCSPCHSRVGDGQGIMVTRGYVPPPNFHTDRIRNMPDGEIFDIITHGIRNMPSYAHQINPDDRWAIVKYIRALQRSHNATINDVPVELRDKIK